MLSTVYCTYCAEASELTGEDHALDHDTEECPRRQQDAERYWEAIWEGRLR